MVKKQMWVQCTKSLQDLDQKLKLQLFLSVMLAGSTINLLEKRDDDNIRSPQLHGFGLGFAFDLIP